MNKFKKIPPHLFPGYAEHPLVSKALANRKPTKRKRKRRKNAKKDSAIHQDKTNWILLPGCRISTDDEVVRFYKAPIKRIKMVAVRRFYCSVCGKLASRTNLTVGTYKGRLNPDGTPMTVANLRMRMLERWRELYVPTHTKCLPKPLANPGHLWRPYGSRSKEAGLLAMGYIPKIQKIIGSLGNTPEAWTVIGEKIGWDPLLAASEYIEYLTRLDIMDEEVDSDEDI